MVNLPSNLIKEFVKVTNDSKPETKQTQFYGTVHIQNDGVYVQIDGSDILTPVNNIVDSQNGDRVMLTIENHSATIIGNFTYPPSQRDTIHAQETADEALDAAGKASASADAAQEAANTLSGKTAEAISKANAAQQTANQAVGDAANAQGQANTALQEANKANQAAGVAKGIADQAVIDANNAKKQADQALADAATADEKAVNAQRQADQAVQDAENAKNLADAAQEDVDAVKEDVSELETGLNNANSAAQTAQNTANKAVQDASVAKQAADKAQEDADAANEALVTAQATADSAIQKANTAQGTADSAVASAASAQASIKTIKDDVATSQAEIEGLATSLDTLSNTMEADYARKTDVSETTAHLQSQISQNAAQIQTTVTKITEVDETVGKAAQDAQAAAEEAQRLAGLAQTQADTATADAAKAQTAANTAKQAADKAQEDATKANQAAVDADAKAVKAAQDLATAQQNLTNVTNRVGATEEEIEAAKAEVIKAQNAANQANTDAQNAAQAAQAAQSTADTAKTNAANAQTAANNAAANAANAQSTANQAVADAEAAQQTANEAKQAAQAAQSTANQAVSDAANAQTAAQNAQKAADDADEKLEQAKTDLAAAQENLTSVTNRVGATEEEIEQAKIDLAAAQKAADDAQDDADAAKLAAQEAANKAQTAQNTADQAVQNALTAQQTANTAKDNAATAQQTANTAKDNAATAQNKANEAAGAAATAQQTATAAQNKANQAASDLAKAEQNLADVTSRVGATEEEIEAAQQAVAVAKKAADDAQADATAAQNAADQAAQDAANAQTTADQAQQAADDAQDAADAAKEAADAAQDAADALAIRVTTAETNILQNAELIKLAATKTEVATTLGGYYTKTQADSAIQVKAENILSTVSSTYQTKSAMSSYPTTTQMNSAINQKAGEITSRVQSTENSITSINGSITSITNRVTAAEQKITPDAIINTVSGTYATKTALASTEAKAADAKTFTDNAKNNYGYQYKYTITANGDANLYYPLILRGGNQNVNREIFVYRGYNDKAPAEWDGHSTTKGISLTLKIETNYGGWGGATYSWYIKELAELYGHVFAGAQNILSGMGFAIMLRGGGTTGATYYIYSDQPLEVNHATGVSPNFYYNSDQFLYNNDSTYKWNAPAPISYTDTVAKNIEAKKFTDAQTVQLNSVIEQKEDSILLQVAQTYATSSSVTTLSATVSGIEGRVSSAEGNISTLTQTATGLTARLDSGVGGRNLVAGTSIDTVYSGNKGSATYKDVWAGKTIDIPTGTEYVVSFDAKADVAQNISCYFYSPNTTTKAISSTGQTSTNADGNCAVSITTAWKRYWVKWTQTAATAVKNIIVGRNTSTNNIHIRAVKLEEGSVPSAWSPAYEDVAKTATNYLSFSSSGLVVGDMTASTLGRNILIDSDSVDVRNGSTVLATFGETTRIGQLTGRNIYIDSDSVDFRNQNTVLARIATNNKTTTNPDTGASVNYAYTWFNTDGILSVDSDDTRLESESSDYKLSAQVRAAVNWEEYSSPDFACVKISTSDSTVSGIRNYSNMYLRPTTLSVNVNDDTDTGRLAIGYDRSLLQVNVWNVTTKYSSIVGLADDFFLVQVTDYNGATATASYYFKTDGLYQNTTRIFDKDGTARYADEISTPRRIKVNLATTDSTGTLFSGASDVTLGVYGTLPTGRGGTGITSNPSMLVNLGSTTAASVFAASPRPGVTGTLPLGNGGTGGTTAAAARANLATWMYAFVSGDTTYPGLARPDGTTTGYVRTPQSGIIPYQNGGHGTVGTSSWPFSNGYFTNLYKGGVAVADVNHTHEWTTVAITTAANCSDASWTGMYSAALNMVSIQGYLLYTPTADLSSGEEIQIGTVAEIGRTTRRIPVTINNNSTNSRRWMGEINTNGVIRLRASGALTKGTSYTIYINAVYFKDF